MAVPLGSVVWGHSTGVTEDNVKALTADWYGTGTISGSGDDEQVCLEDGQYLESQVIETGDMYCILSQNKYVAGDTATIYYRTGSTRAATLTATWTEYTGTFLSSNFVQMMLVNTNAWWLAGGIIPTNTLSTYQAKGAASYASSLVNLANPGVNDLTENVQPSWNTAIGWTSTGASPHFILANGGYRLIKPTTVIVRATSTSSGQILRGTIANKCWYIMLLSSKYYSGANNTGFAVTTNSYPSIDVVVGFVFANNKTMVYVNGVYDTTGSTYYSDPPSDGLTNYLMVGYGGVLSAISIYSSELTAEQVTAVSTALAAL